ncbi:hypothetical protein [Butyrivibrio sp. AE2032]|uniref:hypothetical protein n=1 Tax=Butyrivibrio sp. AE2032 TaxID=1458463 RepID=UPI000AD95343|nr:hypothetical protein [Butyrivibrio sp. AE2032]
MEIEKVLAMAVACVAEESGVDPKHVVVRSFREVPKSSLEQYIEENHINYRKYQLED